MRKSHFNDWLLFLALENFRWSSARNEPKCIFPLKIWRFYYFIFEVVVCGAQVCVCVTPCHRLESVLMFWRRRFFWITRISFEWRDQNPEFWKTLFLWTVVLWGTVNWSRWWRRAAPHLTSTPDRWVLRKHETAARFTVLLYKKMFLVWILVSYLCVCSAVVAVVVRTDLSPVLQLWKFCPNFLLKTFILFVLVHGLLRQRLIFPVKTKTF